jgi:hypothetical protein
MMMIETRKWSGQSRGRRFMLDDPIPDRWNLQFPQNLPRLSDEASVGAPQDAP